jgi:hypothetical protein
MMKIYLVPIFAVLVFSQTSCERHPASVTVPGYAEKQAAKKKAAALDAKTAEPIDPNPPTFFPSPTPAPAH